MRITICDPGPDGVIQVQFGDPSQTGWFSWDATEHDLGDLEAVLAQRKAMTGRCGAEDGEHTCGLWADHAAPVGHQCRACPAEWPTGAVRIEQALKARLAAAPLAAPEAAWFAIREAAGDRHRAGLGPWTYRCRPEFAPSTCPPGLDVQVVSGLHGELWLLLDRERVIAHRSLP